MQRFCLQRVAEQLMKVLPCAKGEWALEILEIKVHRRCFICSSRWQVLT